MVLAPGVRGKWQSRGKLKTAVIKIKTRKNWEEEEELSEGLNGRGRGHDPDNDLMARVAAPVSDGVSAALTAHTGSWKGGADQ